MGFATAMSRIGAAIGTFLLPVSLSGIGIGPTMIIGAILCFAGFVISWFMAPETKDLTLAEASAVGGARQLRDLSSASDRRDILTSRLDGLPGRL
jgi:MFS transporter, putative metabolite transport protein